VNYDLAIFDLDGTLLDSFPWFLDIVNAVADKHRFRRIEPDQVETLRDKDTREIIQFLGVSTWKIPAIARDMRRLKAVHLHEIALFPGVDAMLRDLKACGVTLAMVSSDNEPNVRRALGAANAALISHYACGASLFGKAAKFRQVVKASGIAAAPTFCIGDEVRDREAARKAGLAFGAVTWGYATEVALCAQAPEMMFATMEDIVAAFD
jgi:phosphoglycolate phosphatase